MSWKSSSIMNYDHIPLTRTQKTWLMDIENLLKEMYGAIRAQRIDLIPEQSTLILQRSRKLPKSTRRKRGQSVIQASSEQNLMFLPPLIRKEDMFKQGLVMRKHVMEAADKRAKHRHWQLCYLVMTETELIMYKPFMPEQNRRKSASFVGLCSLQDMIRLQDDWKPDKSQILVRLPMNHVYATILPPPGWNPQRPHVFRLETGEGGLWLFESVDLFAIQAWVEACNLAAARISKGTLPGAISNIDYGWGAQCHTAACQVQPWYPPSHCMISSTLEIHDQYLDIKSQIDRLNVELNEHRLFKLSVDEKSAAAKNQHSMDAIQAVTNWDKKLHYILHEITKLQVYKEMLEMTKREKRDVLVYSSSS
ncbi:Pleckstrin homology domain-containing protein [Gilbertella persicaria]|uniref:Pleckstrin homology domain-containing protein n=1 Tax=Gilbertella persicaria TaxID=101096 RepID=UPI0022209987|nr:Pleckstrin homology domain-containing protein [Gilbertella persicaria]KAI8080189.1 Pleckstrin homology domain-containing protein [Gilbertella persicaria]